jgi:hypothetical protein
MSHPIKSLLLALGLFFLGGVTLAPYTPSKKQIAADGTVTVRTESERRMMMLRVNGFAYACMAGGAVSFAWTLYLVSVGIICVFRARRHDSAA